ncbi:hypothetical protein H0H81_006883 [Sphagnurus paluster]|uniref:Uncharacterized protein n=1 Tax=Sphagnurus paluster TaxID=117069 RepID=A0A9P7KGV6_9AGAR|nr:hypothetical protein H0H81_006883 [Sphagnurus paluster]
MRTFVNKHLLTSLRQYGLPDNTSRPGGPLSTITYVSNTLSASTFRILTDQTTASYLTTSLVACNSYVNVSSDTPSLYPGNSPGTPLPVQALQYYRASSVVLTLDGYNNTAAMLPAGATSNTFLPGGIDANLLNCLNTTIGSTVLLIDPSNPLSGNAVVVIISASLATIAILAYLNCLILDRWRQKRITRTLPVCSAHALGTDKEIVTGPVARPPPAAVAQVPGVPYAPAPSSIDWCSVSTLEEHDSASLVRNARSIDGSPYSEPLSRNQIDGNTSRTSWWNWRRNKGRTAVESIELASQSSA